MCFNRLQKSINVNKYFVLEIVTDFASELIPSSIRESSVVDNEVGIDLAVMPPYVESPRCSTVFL